MKSCRFMDVVYTRCMDNKGDLVHFKGQFWPRRAAAMSF